MRSKRKNKVSKQRLIKSKRTPKKTRKRTRTRTPKKTRTRTRTRKSKKYSRKTRRSFIKKSRRNNRKLKGGAHESGDNLLDVLVGRWEAKGTTVAAIMNKLIPKGKKEFRRLMIDEGYRLDAILQMTGTEMAKEGFGIMDRIYLTRDLPIETEIFTVKKDGAGGYTGGGGSGGDSFTLKNIQVDKDGKVSMEQVYSDGLKTKWLFKISEDRNNLESGERIALDSDYEGKKIGNFTAQRVKTAQPEASQLSQSTEHRPAQVTVNPRAQESEGGAKIWFKFGQPHRLAATPLPFWTFYLNEDGSGGGGDGFHFEKIVSGKGKVPEMGPPVTMVQVFDNGGHNNRWVLNLPKAFSSLEDATAAMAKENPSTGKEGYVLPAVAIFEGEDSSIDLQQGPDEFWDSDGNYIAQTKLLYYAPAQHYKTRNRTIQLKIVQLSQGIAPIDVSLTDNATIAELKDKIRETRGISKTDEFNLYTVEKAWGIPSFYGTTTKWPLKRKEQLTDEEKTLGYYNILTDSTIDIEFV